MLNEAGVGFLTNNENSRSVQPAISMIPTNIAIDILVFEENIKEALEILASIE